MCHYKKYLYILNKVNVRIQIYIKSKYIKLEVKDFNLRKKIMIMNDIVKKLSLFINFVS